MNILVVKLIFFSHKYISIPTFYDYSIDNMTSLSGIFEHQAFHSGKEALRAEQEAFRAEQAVDNSEQAVAAPKSEQAADNSEQAADNSEQAAPNSEQAADNSEQAADNSEDLDHSYSELSASVTQEGSPNARPEKKNGTLTWKRRNGGEGKLTYAVIIEGRGQGRYMVEGIQDEKSVYMWIFVKEDEFDKIDDGNEFTCTKTTIGFHYLLGTNHVTRATYVLNQ